MILTPLSPSGVLEAAASGGVSFASDRRGGYVFPVFLPAFDAAAALARLISLLGQATTSLAEVVEATPAMPVWHEEVPTPLEHKGLIMRTMMEQLTDEGAELVLVDGIKVISDAGWVLVVPDPEDPVTHVWAEAADLVASEALAAAYVGRIAAHGSLADGPAGRVGRPVGSGPVNVPEELRYSEEHEWVRVEGTRVRIGITDYAQDALGDIVFVDLPAVGSEIEVGGQLGEVESTKSVSEIYAPLSGTVTAVNDALAGGPERINQDPYGEGWICELELAPGADPGGLLDAAAYGELIAG